MSQVRELLDIRGLRELNYNAVFARVMRRNNITRLVRWVNMSSTAVLVLSAIVLLVVLGQDIISKMTVTSKLDSQIASIGSSARAGAAGPLAPALDWNVVQDRKPFGILGKVVAPVPAAPTPPPSPLMLSLIGTFLTQGQEPYAIIEDKKKNEQEMFLIGDSIFDQAKLKKIYLDRVEVERNGKLEVLRLDELGGNAGAGIVTTGSDDFVVEEAELDKGLENLPLLLTQARAVPYFKDGRSIGLRLFAIKTGSLYEKVGLKNGDILKTINGNNLGDISQALKLFEQLKQERSINLTLERDKQEREFKYTIR
jgi:general secretion pathway protein C